MSSAITHDLFRAQRNSRCSHLTVLFVGAIVVPRHDPLLSFFYTAKKNPRTVTRKLEFRKVRLD